MNLNDILESELGLHEEIRLYYVVDGYIAELSKDDGNSVSRKGEGATPLEAIENLFKLEDSLITHWYILHPRLGWTQAGPCEAACVLVGPVLEDTGEMVDPNWLPWKVCLGKPKRRK